MFQWTESLSEEERISKNVVNLISIRKNELCFDRTLGISCDGIDKSINNLNSEIITEISDLIEEREPRVVVNIDEIIETNAYSDESMKVVLKNA